MDILVIGVTKVLVVIMVTIVDSVLVVGMVTRTHDKCFGLHIFSNLFALSPQS